MRKDLKEMLRQEDGKIRLRSKNNEKKDITVIGGAVLDVLAGPVTPDLFRTGSQPMKTMRLSYGGDALNEAIALSRMGKRVELITKLGQDGAGDKILAYMRKEGVLEDGLTREPGLETSMNIVLVDGAGERHFLTNPKGSLRRLSEEDVVPYLDAVADIVSFAGVFVSHQLDIPSMERIFARIKAKPGRTLAVDMTKAKKGEQLEDLKGMLPYVDYIFPNEEEIALLTGIKNPYVNAGLLVRAGVSCAVIKCGKKGCLICTEEGNCEIPAYPVKEAVDSTGAGDCFAAGFLWALSQGMLLEDCGRFACATASCTVEHMGAVEGIHSIEEPMRRYRRSCH